MTLQQATIEALIAAGWTAEQAGSAVVAGHGIRDRGEVVLEATLPKVGYVDDYQEWLRTARRYISFSNVTVSEDGESFVIDASLYAASDGVAVAGVWELYGASGGPRTIGHPDSNAAFMDITGAITAR